MCKCTPRTRSAPPPQPEHESILGQCLLGGLDLEVYLDGLWGRQLKKEKKVVNIFGKKNCTPRQNPDYTYEHAFNKEAQLYLCLLLRSSFTKCSPAGHPCCRSHRGRSQHVGVRRSSRVRRVLLGDRPAGTSLWRHWWTPTDRWNRKSRDCSVRPVRTRRPTLRHPRSLWKYRWYLFNCSFIHSGA